MPIQVNTSLSIAKKQDQNTPDKELVSAEYVKNSNSGKLFIVEDIDSIPEDIAVGSCVLVYTEIPVTSTP